MQKKSSSSVRIFYPKFDRKALIQQLKKKLGNLARELPLSLVILFGSYARGNYTVGSDIDLLIVYRGKKKKDAFAIAKKTLDIPMLEPHLYSEDEYEPLKKTIDQMTSGGVVIFSSSPLSC